jgi:SAM-dependent methyltransferase
MPPKVTNPAIIHFLKTKFKGAGFIDSLKIKYRSLICPFINLIEMVNPGDKVGDVGCGSGQFLLLLTEFAKPSYLFGIEISKKLIDNANKLFSSLPDKAYNFTQYDGIHFPKELRGMDIIFLIDVLHHVPKNNQINFINDLVNSMKPGARLVLKDINGDSPLVYFNKMHDLLFAREISNEIGFEKAKSLLNGLGLTIIEQNKKTMYVYPHYTIVAKK